MSLIHALLSLPDHGEPMMARGGTEAILRRASARFVHCCGGAWSLTDDGRRFLGQFRPDHKTIDHIVVRLVREAARSEFHLLCDSGRVLRVRRTDLLHCLRTIRANNPGVKINFDFRHSGGVS